MAASSGRAEERKSENGATGRKNIEKERRSARGDVDLYHSKRTCQRQLIRKINKRESHGTYMALQPLLVDATKQPSVVAMGMYTGCIFSSTGRNMKR